MTRNKILVVDDEVQVSSITELMLTQFGIDVITASSGRAALDILEERSEEIGLVLMDLTMPGLSGQETFERMRRAHPDLEVVFTSGLPEWEVQPLLSRDGVVGFLRKPFALESLLSTVRGAMASG